MHRFTALVTTLTLLAACSGDGASSDGATSAGQGAGTTVGQGGVGSVGGGSSSGGGSVGGGVAVGGGGPAEEPVAYQLGYSSFLGGLGWERAQAVYVDPQGSIFVGGNTSSSDFPVTPGAFQTNKLGPSDGNQADSQTGYIVRLDPTGTTIEWATYLGGTRRDQVYAIRTDSVGNIYAVGGTNSNDFPTTPGAFDTTYNGPFVNNGLTDIFVTKFDPQGNLLFSTYVGGSTPGEENPRGAIEIDEVRGRIYVAGLTKATDFPTTPGSFQPNYGGGGEDGFVFALSLDGSTMVAATYIGGSGLDMAFSEIEQHADGSLLVGGWTTSQNFPTTPGAFQENYGGSRDGWVARLSPDLDQLVFATYLGGSGYDAVNHNQGLAIDAQGRAVVVGGTQSSNFPVTAGAYQTDHGGMTDAFVAVLSEDGSDLVHSSFYGGSANDTPAGVFVTPSGQVAFTGLTNSADLPLAQPHQSQFSGNANSTDIMVTVMAPDLSALVLGTYLGGAGTQMTGERGRCTWVTPSGEIWVSGVTDNGGFPITPDAQDTTYGGQNADAVYFRFDPVFP